LTLLDQQQRELELVAGAGVPTRTRAVEPARAATRRFVATAVTALLIVVVAWAGFELFEGPVAQAWYHTRQHQLGSQFAAQRAHTGPGAAIAVLQVPRLGINVVVSEGDSPQQLRGGPGHRIGTPLPGDVGNSVVVGHRAGLGGAFSGAGALRTGDLIVVQDYASGNLRNAVFKVVSQQRVPAGSVAPFVGSTYHRLTIVTGAGGQFDDGRLVIVAVSGTTGNVLRPAADVRATTRGGSRLWNAQVLLALFGLGGAVLVARRIRPRYRPSIVVVAVAPLAVLGCFGLLLNLDLFLSPLR